MPRPKRVRMKLLRHLTHDYEDYYVLYGFDASYVICKSVITHYLSHLKLKPGQSREVWVDIRFVEGK